MCTIPTVKFRLASSTALAVVGSLLLAVSGPGSATGGERQPTTHRYIPSRDLIGYLEFDGLDAHAAAWKGTAAHAIFAKTKAGAMVNEVTRQWAHWLMLKDLGGLSGADVIAIRDHLVSNGLVLAVHANDEHVMVTVVLNNFKREELLDRFRGLRLFLFGLKDDVAGMLEGPVRFRGRLVYRMDNREEPVPEKKADKVSSLANSWFATWFEGDDLVIVYNDVLKPEQSQSALHEARLNAILDTIEGKLPNVTSHPRYLAALAGDEDLKNFEPLGLFFAGPTENKGLITAFSDWIPDADDGIPARPTPGPDNVKLSRSRVTAKTDDNVRPAATATSSPATGLLDADVDLTEHGLAPVVAREPASRASFPRQIQRWRRESAWAGVETDMLEELKGLTVRWGIQGAACITDVRIEAPVPRKVIDVVFNQPRLNKTQLPPLPRGVNSFAIASFDAARSYQSFTAMLSANAPDGGAEARRIESLLRDKLQVQHTDDFLKHIGPTWWAFQPPSSDPDRDEPDVAESTSRVILTSVDDAKAFAKVLDTLAAQINESMEHADPAENTKKKDAKPDRARAKALEKLPPPNRGYRLTPAGCRALGLSEDFEQVIVLGDSMIAVAASVDRACEALASWSKTERSRGASDQLAKALELLPPGLTFLAVTDPRDSFMAEGMVALSEFVQFLANMSMEDDPDHASAQALWDLFGIPRPGGLRLQIKQVPTAEDLLAHLFPSMLAGAADSRGYRLITREAFPGALLLNVTKINRQFTIQWFSDSGFRLQEGCSIRILGFDTDHWAD
jgi:hypothetical protein